MAVCGIGRRQREQRPTAHKRCARLAPCSACGTPLRGVVYARGVVGNDRIFIDYLLKWEFMNIVIDMDNTLTDEFGSSTRPGIVEFLQKLKNEGHVLLLWTNSTKERAVSILSDHKLNLFFSKFIFREDYDPKNIGLNKDIRNIKGDILIDDDPNEINYMKKINKKGILITSYRKGKSCDKNELNEIYKQIKSSKSIFDLFK